MYWLEYICLYLIARARKGDLPNLELEIQAISKFLGHGKVTKEDRESEASSFKRQLRLQKIEGITCLSGSDVTSTAFRARKNIEKRLRLKKKE